MNRPTPERSSRLLLCEAEFVGGHERRQIEIVGYRSAWRALFEEHRRRIETALHGLAVRIDHVGSTAVPGLPAKPIVDIQVSVFDAEDEAAYARPLKGAGYDLRVREAGHRMFRTPGLDVHLHVCAVGSAWEWRHLLFRDYLRHSSTDRELYARTKRELAARAWPTMNHYADAKTEVIADIMARAEHWAHSTGWGVR